MTKKSYWQRLQRERISRRRLLGAAGVGAAGLAVAAACGGGDDGDGDETPVTGETPGATATTEPGTPVHGGRFINNETVDFDTLDPVLGITASPGYFPRMYNVLVNQSATKPEFIVRDLAEDWEQPDDETYIFKIRPDAVIAPNDLGIPERPLDGEDARVSITRMQTDEGANAGAFTKQWIGSMVVSDEGATFTLKTKGPYAYFLNRIGHYTATLFPREFVEQEIDMATKGVGAGAFVLVPGSFIASQGLKLDRNPNYYGKDPGTGEQLPYADGFDALVIPDRSARRTAFLSQQIHTYGAENLQEAEGLLAQESRTYMLKNPYFYYVQFVVNPNRPPWDDARIRKAANFALNRQEFVDVIDQGEGAPNGLVHWATGSYALPPEELAQLQPHDPEESRRLIQEATGQDTVTIKVMYPANETTQKHNQHLPIFLEQLEAAGFAIEQEPEAFSGWFTRYQQKEYDASLSLNQLYETPEIPLDWQHSLGPIGDETYAVGVGAFEPGVDEAIENAKRVTDPEELIEAVRQVQRLIYEKGPTCLPIYGWYDYVLYWDFVKNWPEGLGPTDRLIYDWWLEGAPS